MSRRNELTSLPLRQLTNAQGDSHHLYFTNSGWHDSGRRLVFVSTRSEATDLFSMELESGCITQLTQEQGKSDFFMFTSLNPLRPEAYFWRSAELIALDLETLAERILYATPDGYSNNMTSVTCDGRFVCTAHYEDLRHRFKIDLLNGYVGFEDYWAAKPRSTIVLIDTVSGSSQIVFEENAWIGHVNGSPTMPHLLTYCHEGPWKKVDNRIWGLDLRDGRSWMIRPRKNGESVGHEYWLADGVSIGFQGVTAEGRHLFGSIRHDNTGLQEMTFAMQSMHVHSNDLQLIVGDGNKKDPHLYVWKFEKETARAPVAVLRHGCSAKIQARHVHPRLSPDSRHLIYVSDQSGYGNLFQIAIADIRAARLLE